jgi:hypothetical protein
LIPAQVFDDLERTVIALPEGPAGVFREKLIDLGFHPIRMPPGKSKFADMWARSDAERWPDKDFSLDDLLYLMDSHLAASHHPARATTKSEFLAANHFENGSLQGAGEAEIANSPRTL